MNIFVTSKCPIESASYLDDKRVNKMILESTQLLCTALNLNGVVTPYRSNHMNHPCAIWARQSQANWLWLMKHAYALATRFELYRNKRHACVDVLDQIRDLCSVLPDITQTPFVNCARNQSLGIDYKHVADVHLAYQLYLNDRWDNDKLPVTFNGMSSRAA